MSYATRSDLSIPEEVLLWLTTDPADHRVTPDETLIAQDLSGADATIHSYLRNRYPVLPLDDPEGELRDIASVIARYRLYSRRHELAEQQPTLRQDYQDALAALREIRDGKRTLSSMTGGETVAAAESGRVRVATRERTFHDDLMGRY